MVKEKIKRVTLMTGVMKTLSFQGIKAKAFFVKNLSVSDVTVSFAPIVSGEGFLIPSKTAQFCVANLAANAPDNTGTDTVYLSGSGDVEVQAIWY